MEGTVLITLRPSEPTSFALFKMASENPDIAIMAFHRSNKPVLGYCLIVGLGAMLFGIDQGETTGFLAMQRYLQPDFV